MSVTHATVLWNMHQYCAVIVNKVVGLHNCYYNQEYTYKVCKLVIISKFSTKRSWCVVVMCRPDNACVSVVLSYCQQCWCVHEIIKAGWEAGEAVHWTNPRLANHGKMTAVLVIKFELHWTFSFSSFFSDFLRIKWLLWIVQGVDVNRIKVWDGWRYQDFSYWNKEQKKRDRHQLLT